LFYLSKKKQLTLFCSNELFGIMLLRLITLFCSNELFGIMLLRLIIAVQY